MKRADVLKAAKTQERPGKSKQNRPLVSGKERLVVNFIAKCNRELLRLYCFWKRGFSHFYPTVNTFK